MEGFYDGHEHSFLVVNDQHMMNEPSFRKTMFQLGREYRQASILYKKRKTDDAYLIFTYTKEDKWDTRYNGRTNYPLGTLIPVRKRGEHIELNGKTWEEEYKDRGFEGTEEAGYSIPKGNHKDGFRYGRQ
jgi:hypothetical protein